VRGEKAAITFKKKSIRPEQTEWKELGELLGNSTTKQDMSRGGGIEIHILGGRKTIGKVVKCRTVWYAIGKLVEHVPAGEPQAKGQDVTACGTRKHQTSTKAEPAT